MLEATSMIDRLFEIFYSLTTVAWVFLNLAFVAIAFARFRATATGILIGGSCLLDAIKIVIVKIAHWILTSAVDPLSAMDPMSGVADARIAISICSFAIGFLLTLCMAAGVALIPRSLGKLAARGRA